VIEDVGFYESKKEDQECGGAAPGILPPAAFVRPVRQSHPLPRVRSAIVPKQQSKKGHPEGGPFCFVGGGGGNRTRVRK